MEIRLKVVGSILKVIFCKMRSFSVKDIEKLRSNDNMSIGSMARYGKFNVYGGGDVICDN